MFIILLKLWQYQQDFLRIWHFQLLSFSFPVNYHFTQFFHSSIHGRERINIFHVNRWFYFQNQSILVKLNKTAEK